MRGLISVSIDLLVSMPVCFGTIVLHNALKMNVGDKRVGTLGHSLPFDFSIWDEFTALHVFSPRAISEFMCESCVIPLLSTVKHHIEHSLVFRRFAHFAGILPALRIRFLFELN